MEDICRDILRDFRHTFNPQTKLPYGGVWSAGHFYEKYHLLIALVTDVYINKIGESNLEQLYIIAEKTCEKVRQTSQIM
jgi:hypothetical protein